MADGPSRFGEFVVDALLGEGGMGKVYRARQVALDRWVALKVLAPARYNKEFAERFYQEARSAARLVHPSIIQIYTVGEHDGIPFFAMEYIDGIDLEQLLRKDPSSLSLEETVEIVRNVAKALSMGLEFGIVHRDIKPGNIMLTKTGLVKVMDFGLAKGIASVSATNPGVVVGTPAYMSPEQGAGDPVDIRSDIYSLGCVMYRCLCERQPFQADNPASLIYKHTYEDPVPPRSICADLPPEAERLCLKMLAKKPEDRFQDPKALLEALAQVPANAGVGEMLLAKRVGTVVGKEKERAPEPAAGLKEPGAKAAPWTPAAAPAQAEAAGVRAASPEALAASVLPKTMLMPPPEVASLSPQAPGVAEEQAPRAAAAKQESGAIAAPQTPATKAPTQAGVLRTDILRRNFQKLPDGRWTYKNELAECRFAEGLAATIKAPQGHAPGGLGDCLLCTNWNRHIGCAVAYTHDIEARQRYEGLKLLVEQAAAWTGAGNFEKAIMLLAGYIETKPKDPEGYKELARLYNRPDYRGRDRRRAVVLYERFVELARAAGNSSNFEIARAMRRAKALLAMPEQKSPGIAPGSGLAFQCFHHGTEGCFAYGVLTASQLVVARAGYIDPQSGVTAAATGSAMVRATSIFRHFRSEKAEEDEKARTRKELSRLSGLTLEELAKDPACVLAATYDELEDCAISVGEEAEVITVTLKGPRKGHLVFSKAGSFRAEQCYELMRRKLAKP